MGGGAITLIPSDDTTRRYVFGRAPSQEEANEATSELKFALEELIYSHSASAPELLKASPVVQEPVRGYSERQACVKADGVVLSSSLSKNVCQALSLLNGSDEAQSTVASVASDENVWNAVMQNEMIMELLQLQKPSPPLDMDLVITELSTDTKSLDEYKTLDSEDNNIDPEESDSGIVKVLNKIMRAFIDILQSMSAFFDIIFGEFTSSFINTDGKTSSTSRDRTTGVAFMALGILAIVMVVLKRGETSVAVQLMNQQNVKYINFLLKSSQTK